MAIETHIYTITEKDQQHLLEQEVSLDQLLHFDRPSGTQMRHLEQLGFGFVDIVLLGDLRGNIIDALTQVEPLTFPTFQQLLQEKGTLLQAIAKAKKHFIYIAELHARGNLFPGKRFSKERLREILQIVKKQDWTSQTLGMCLSELLRELKVEIT